MLFDLFSCWYFYGYHCQCVQNAAPDLTVLSVIFGVNIGFSSIDSIVAGLVATMQGRISKKISKYRTGEWMMKIAPSETAIDKAKREILNNALKKEVGSVTNEVQNLFNTNAIVWKKIMALAAIVSFFLMVIKFDAWLTNLLILPIPLFLVSCRIERWCFFYRLRKGCRKVEDICSTITDERTPSGSEIKDRLLSEEAKIQSVPMPPFPFSPNVST